MMLRQSSRAGSRRSLAVLLATLVIALGLSVIPTAIVWQTLYRAELEARFTSYLKELQQTAEQGLLLGLTLPNIEALEERMERLLSNESLPLLLCISYQQTIAFEASGAGYLRCSEELLATPARHGQVLLELPIANNLGYHVGRAHLLYPRANLQRWQAQLYRSIALSAALALGIAALWWWLTGRRS